MCQIQKTAMIMIETPPTDPPMIADVFFVFLGFFCAGLLLALGFEVFAVPLVVEVGEESLGTEEAKPCQLKKPSFSPRLTAGVVDFRVHGEKLRQLWAAPARSRCISSA